MQKFSRLAAVLSGALLAALLAASSANAKEIAAFPSADRTYVATITTLPEGGPDRGLVLNQMLVLDIKVAAKDPAHAAPVTHLVFDARMPEHDHGMVVTPRVTEIAPGDFKVEGVKLHMAGNWQLLITADAGGKSEKFTVPVQI